MYHEAFTDVEFTCQYPVRLWDHDYRAGDVLTVSLVLPWDDQEEGLGEGGPWGWGGYPSQLIAELSGDVKAGHTHTCTECCREIEYSTEFDCEIERDHAFHACSTCS